MDIAKFSLVGEGSISDSLETGLGGVVHVEHVGGGQESGAGGIAETVDGHLVVKRHIRLWLDGSPVDFTNWREGEPNDAVNFMNNFQYLMII